MGVRLLIFGGRIIIYIFDTSGSMVPRLVPEISSLDAFCDGAAGGAGAGAGIGDSRSLITKRVICVGVFPLHLPHLYNALKREKP